MRKGENELGGRKVLPPALRRFVDMFNVVSGSQQMIQASVSSQQQWEMGMQTGSFTFHMERCLTSEHPSVPTLSGLSESTDTGNEGLGADSPLECASV